MTTPKNILITGASSGFGQLVVKLLVDQGHRVIAGLRGGQGRLDETFDASLRESDRLFAADLHMERPETFDQARQLVDSVFDGRLDVLINNAGYGLLAPAEDQSEAKIRHQVEVNFIGPVLLTNALLPALRVARGRILNVSSVVGFVALPLYSLYAATKHALEGYSEGMAFDLEPFGIQVGLIQPGGFETSFASTAAKATADVPEGSLYASQSRQINRFLIEKAPKVIGDPRVVARLIARLCVKKRVPLRSTVGKDARLMAVLRWLLPDRARLWLVSRGFGRLLASA